LQVDGMPDLDYALVKRLQADLGRIRQAEVERRRTAGLGRLSAEDARQHGRTLVERVVSSYESEIAEAGVQELPWEARQELVDALEARLFGAGSLQSLLDDERVENIDINGYRHVFVEYADGTTARVSPIAGSNEELIETVQTLAAHEGLSARAFDVANVRVNLRLHDGSRLYAVQSVTREPVISIRRHRHLRVRIKDLIGLDTLDDDLGDFLGALVRAWKNVMIAGATGSGKTTLLRALAAEIPAEERVLTVERSLELGLDLDADAHPNAIAFEERLANAEGAGRVTMAELVRDTLRMNPSRVIVGEVLGDEVVNKIATYAIQAPERLPWEASVRLVASALGFIVFLRRHRDHDDQHRTVESVREIAGVSEDGQLLTNEVWSPADDGLARRTPGVQVRCEADLIAVGWTPVPGEPGRWSR
jgi:Flp pilus assembly CpaF family ATPase